jgi:hypothetical protein
MHAVNGYQPEKSLRVHEIGHFGGHSLVVPDESPGTESGLPTLY